MIKILNHLNRHVVFGVALATSGSMIGCEYFPESTFQLASESRLPKWIALPPGLTRANASITLSYFTKPWGASAKFILQDTKKQVIEESTGKVKCRESFHLKDPPEGSASGYPSYEAIDVNGITEIIEHKKMEPIFYVTDDTAVWKQYESIGC